MACPRVFFDITAGGNPVGRIIMEVRPDFDPKIEWGVPPRDHVMPVKRPPFYRLLKKVAHTPPDQFVQ